MPQLPRNPPPKPDTLIAAYELGWAHATKNATRGDHELAGAWFNPYRASDENPFWTAYYRGYWHGYRFPDQPMPRNPQLEHS
jgi:hypothetical protein